MSFGTINFRTLLTGLFLASVSTILTPASHVEQQTSQIQFINSCSDAVQEKFNHAIILLHSFEYTETTRLFNEIAEEDPDCAMAYWGSAMSIWHPLWEPPSAADLEEGATLLARAKEMNATARESAYIEALGAFFSSNEVSSHSARTREYESRMGVLYADNLDDPDAAVFYALALLASADPRDRSYSNQFKSAGLLNWVRATHPTHPGVLHYLIHSYDYPGLAHLALDAATVYADAAPDSTHAQHMPSHIFTRLGLWERAISSNHDSIRSAAEHTIRANLPGHDFQGLHGIDYLMYAMLQTARDEEARQLLERLGSITRTNTENIAVAYAYASSPARFALERREWSEASDLQFVRSDFVWDEYPWTQSTHYFARGIGSARSGQLTKARQEVEAIEALLIELPAVTPVYFRTEVEVQIKSVNSWILFAQGNSEQALSLASMAADQEDAVDKHPVTPGEVLPARELFADMLFEAGNYPEALDQYQVVLRGSPNRLNAMLGAARAAARLDNAEMAEDYHTVIRQQTSLGNSQREGLAFIWEASHQ